MRSVAQKIIGSLISLASLTGMFWWNVVPQAPVLCEGDSYTVETVDGEGNPVTLVFQDAARTQLCSHVAANPIKG